MGEIMFRNHSVSKSAKTVVLGILVLVLLAVGAAYSPAAKAPFANPTVDDSLAASSSHETAVFAGGCFWGIQAVFEHVKGVTKATAGYAGGVANTAHYEMVSTGATGHAESVEVTYDPSQITYGQLLKVYFAVAHDPTELNRQGPDEGTQYRSSVFYANDSQKKIAEAYIAQLDDAKTFHGKIVTQVVPLKGFFAAELYHQDYAMHNPTDLYIMINDAPKVRNLKKQFPEMYFDYKG
jgi:peptide-methionine (S)-S-oxide reductase